MKKIIAMLLLVALMIPSGFVGATTTVEEDSTDYTQMIANDEKVVEMLVESGTIDKDATQGEIKRALNAFIKNKSKKFKEKGNLAPLETKRLKNLNDKARNFTSSETTTLQAAGSSSVVADNFTGTQQEDRILAILINFPDYDGSTLTTEYTDMYYPEYTTAHYQDLLFGDSYAGPSGQDFISMKSYYEQQSGGAYTVTGNVVGWYTAAHPASYYGGNDRNDNDSAPQELVKEALAFAASELGAGLSYYDQEDRYDLDGDGNYREPDGLIDHVMVFHASVGEEAGGGELGADAIWAHRWNLGAEYDLGVPSGLTGDFFSNYTAYDYTIQPIDAAAGVCAHEYGHDLGLPDEYDTNYSSEAGEPVSYWSIMSSGSWAGEIGGTEPTGFSAYAKHFFAATINPYWFDAKVVDLSTMDPAGVDVVLDEAATKGTNYDGVKIILPADMEQVVTPLDANGHYYSTMGNDLSTSMEATIDLTSTRRPSVTMDMNYIIEKDWDYAYVYVTDQSGTTTNLSSRITSRKNPNGNNLGNGITGNSNGWVNASFDLSIYSGQVVTLGIKYITDEAAMEYGLSVDNIQVKNGKKVIFSDSDQSAFTLNGFENDSFGLMGSSTYYLAEWRTHNGVDAGLAHIKRGDSLMQFEEGMLLWYVDDSYQDNWVGDHPGYGFLGVVDASQEALRWTDNTLASTKYLLHDAAFSLTDTAPMLLDYTSYYGTETILRDDVTAAVPVFMDTNDYSSPFQPESGKVLPQHGLKIEVIDESADQSIGTIRITK